MFEEENQIQATPKEQQLKVFRSTALGRMFSRSYLTDTKGISRLLRQKRQEASDIDVQSVCVKTPAPRSNKEEWLIDRPKTYRMPTIRKSPLKLVMTPRQVDEPLVHEYMQNYDEMISDDTEVY